MAITRATPTRFTPSGLVDGFDATNLFPGACQALTNLVFDQFNPEFVVNAPGRVTLATFANAGFVGATFISIQQTVGTRVYGMIATSRNAGQDEPFCFDTVAGGFVAISNVTAGNTPTSPALVGDWTPPTLDVIGTMVVITHPGFNGAGANFYGVIDITTPDTPAWRDENVTTNALPSVPTAVANFNNRAWFSCGSLAVFTDVLTNPLTRTFASQAIQVGDQQPINAMKGLPIQTTGAGVVQSLNIYKQTQLWAVTGDFSQSSLNLAYLSLTIGTISPRSVVQAPYGQYFISSGGPYMVDLLGAVQAVVNQQGSQQPDIQAPFQNAVNPTRWAAAYSNPVYRCCGPTVINGSQSTNDYWFDEHKRRWSGPHTFAYDCASALGEVFVLSYANNPGILMSQSPIPGPTQTITDLGAQINFALLSCTFPKTGDMFVKQVAESQIELAAVNGLTTYNIVAGNESGGVLGAVSLVAGTTPPLWGGMGLLWGAAGLLWTSTQQPLRPKTYPVYWTAPLVFEKMALSVGGAVTSNVGIGTFYARYQQTGYMTTGIE